MVRVFYGFTQCLHGCTLIEGGSVWVKFLLMSFFELFADVTMFCHFISKNFLILFFKNFFVDEMTKSHYISKISKEDISKIFTQTLHGLTTLEDSLHSRAHYTVGLTTLQASLLHRVHYGMGLTTPEDSLHCRAHTLWDSLHYGAPYTTRVAHCTVGLTTL